MPSPKKQIILSLLLFLTAGSIMTYALTGKQAQNLRDRINEEDVKTRTTRKETMNTENNDQLKKATFGGGCFWCIESVFKELKGVESVVSGYSGGDPIRISYKEVCTGTTGHAEVIQVSYDPDKISFEELLAAFWQSHDPTTLNRQGNDVGTQYRSVIFYHDEEQKKEAEYFKKKLDEAKIYSEPIVTEISPLEEFFPAENYHQNYYQLNKEQPYCVHVIRPKLEKFRKVFKDKLKKSEESSSGKHSLEKIKKSEDEWQKQLTPMQYKVTRTGGTERAFSNEYWDNKKKGVYECVCCGLPLFHSEHKYKSGTGWPSFWTPIDKKHVTAEEDRKFFMVRTEIKCSRCDAHLGHVFDDGPQPTGLRYCMNSAALSFQEKEGSKDSTDKAE